MYNIRRHGNSPRYRTTYVKHAACSLDVEALEERADEMADKEKLFFHLDDWLEPLPHETTIHEALCEDGSTDSYVNSVTVDCGWVSECLQALVGT